MNFDGHHPVFVPQQELIFVEENGYLPWKAEFGAVDVNFKDCNGRDFKLHSSGIRVGAKHFCLRMHPDGRFSLDLFHRYAHYSMAVGAPASGSAADIDEHLIQCVMEYVKSKGLLAKDATFRLQSVNNGADAAAPPPKHQRIAA